MAFWTSFFHDRVLQRRTTNDVFLRFPTNVLRFPTRVGRCNTTKSVNRADTIVAKNRIEFDRKNNFQLP